MGVYTGMYLGFRGVVLWLFLVVWVQAWGFLFVGVGSLSYIKRIVYKEGREGNEYRTGFMKKVFSLCTCVDWGSDCSTCHPQGLVPFALCRTSRALHSGPAGGHRGANTSACCSCV